jgi:23S rRNA pseudouridine1911/1915/1917 synthase
MPFVLKKFPAVQGKKIQLFLMNDVGLSLSQSQKLLAKKRVFDDKGNMFQNGQTLNCEFVQVALFEGQTRGLKPMFDVNDFAVFDKPSGVMVHPTSRTTEYTLLDEIRHHFGENANLAHRIDAETSGLVLVTKNKYADMILKEMFENKDYKKEYLAIVRGEIKESLSINSPISKENGFIGVRMTTLNENGKESLTHIEPVKYNKENNTTLVRAKPVTGRQHQIRVHLHSVGHTILGDPIYGIDDKTADDYLLKKLSPEDRLKATGASRLMLHANTLEFEYENKTYKISSKMNLSDA